MNLVYYSLGTSDLHIPSLGMHACMVAIIKLFYSHACIYAPMHQLPCPYSYNHTLWVRWLKMRPIDNMN